MKQKRKIMKFKEFKKWVEFLTISEIIEIMFSDKLTIEKLSNQSQTKK